MYVYAPSSVSKRALIMKTGRWSGLWNPKSPTNPTSLTRFSRPPSSPAPPAPRVSLVPPVSVDGEDHIGGLDHRGDLAALFQPELLHGLDRDRGDQTRAAGFHDHVGGGLAGPDLGDRGRDLVPGAQLHARSPLIGVGPSLTSARPPRSPRPRQPTAAPPAPSPPAPPPSHPAPAPCHPAPARVTQRPPRATHRRPGPHEPTR